jgi:hypothetical protein
MPTSTRQVLGERTLVYREYSFYGRPSEAEDPPELGSDQRTGKFPGWPKWQTVVDLITNRGCSSLFKKPVAVDPLPVGTFYLFVYKSKGRLPERNIRSPHEGNTEQAQPIVNASIQTHQNGLWCGYVKVELRRGDALQVGCIAEECKDRLNI